MSAYNDNMNKKAVALRYDEEKVAAPVIVATGMGYMAEKIIEVAGDNGVPVYEDNSLATILSQLELGNEIPEELYRAVVDIYVYFLNFSLGRKTVPENEEQADDGSSIEQDQTDTEQEESELT